MTKRLLLALAVVAGLAGCGINGDALRNHTDNRYLMRVRAEIPTLADQTDTDLLTLSGVICGGVKNGNDRDDYVELTAMLYGNDEESFAERVALFDLSVEYFCPTF